MARLAFIDVARTVPTDLPTFRPTRPSCPPAAPTHLPALPILPFLPSRPKEWDAASYHKVAAPQTAWGQRVLSRLTVNGDERVIDAGCGTGRLTGELMAMIPRGRLIAIDRSWNMLITARANLRPDFGVARRLRPRRTAAPAVRRLGRSGVQHGDVPLGARSPGAVRGDPPRPAAERPALRAVRRRSEPRRGARARRRR